MLAMLAAAILVTLSGCSYAPSRVEPPTPVHPPVSVGADTWSDVGEEIWNASRLASAESQDYARQAMVEWMERVKQQTEEAFVPWFLDYWTQKWISLKLAWYGAGQEEGEPSAVERLAAYLEEEYQARALDPVAEEIDASAIRDSASEMYLQLLSTQLRDLPERIPLPPEALERRLSAIVAIHLQGDPGPSASLSELLDAGRVTSNPAYARLIRQTGPAALESSDSDITDELHPVARIAADKLADSVAIQGGSSAAAAVVGGQLGILISAGAFAWGAYTHERDKPALEAQLRNSLDAALPEIWHYLVEDPHTGVTAPVRHMSTQIERGLGVPYPAPVRGTTPLRGNF